MQSLQPLKDFYNTGTTLTYEFRKKQLQALLQAIIKYDEYIAAALHTDLKKSKEEAWGTETGLLITEIKHALKNLHKWMRPKKVATGLITFPSSGKIYHDPLGMIFIISPWNYPLQLSLVPLVGAIAAGNVAVIKPSELAPATQNIIVKIIEATFPENYIRVVTGDGAEVVPALIGQEHFNHIFYTGSTAVGKEIYKMAASQLIPVTLELGGKSPCIVEADADINVAAKRIVFGKFVNAGQTCIAPDYVLAHASIKEALLKAMTKAIEKFFGADASRSGDYGKIINEKRFEALTNLMKDGSIFYGGHTNPETLYVEPTLLTDISMNDPIMKEEIFGPLLPVLSFNTTEEAMEIVQKNKNPLSFYLFTKNKRTEQQWLRHISFGGGCINNTVYHFANINMPFGGIGNSGIGSYHGQKTFYLFSHSKPVLKSATWFDPDLKYPPMKGKLNLLKRLIN